jgi:uncharacterized protein (UPF0335 family)
MTTVVPFKKDPDFAVHNEAAVSPVREVLCTLISNLESLEMERADIVREITDNLCYCACKGFEHQVLFARFSRSAGVRRVN